MRIFISYAREDYEMARRLFESLKAIPALDPWLDKENLLPGVAWEEETLRAIDESRYVILLLSEHSVSKAGFVQTEIKEALKRFSHLPPGKIFIIPARLSDCSPRYRELQQLNWVDLFVDWNDGVSRIVRALTIDQSAIASFGEYVASIRTLNPKAVPIIEAHPRGGEILQAMYNLRTGKSFPRRMSLEGEIVHNPIYRSTTPDSEVVIEPLVRGRLAGNLRVMLLYLYLIKGYDREGQPAFLQYFSGTHSAGWQTWLFPHGLGFQRNAPTEAERMALNARDLEITAGLQPESASISYMPQAEYLVSIKPDFGYRNELVLYCFFFCSVRVVNPPAYFLSRNFEISRGEYPRRYRWFYFEELQNDRTILSKNSDVIKAIHTLYATSLVPVPSSLDVPLGF